MGVGFSWKSFKNIVIQVKFKLKEVENSYFFQNLISNFFLSLKTQTPNALVSDATSTTHFGKESTIVYTRARQPTSTRGPRERSKRLWQWNWSPSVALSTCCLPFLLDIAEGEKQIGGGVSRTWGPHFGVYVCLSLVEREFRGAIRRDETLAKIVR